MNCLNQRGDNMILNKGIIIMVSADKYEHIIDMWDSYKDCANSLHLPVTKVRNKIRNNLTYKYSHKVEYLLRRVNFSEEDLKEIKNFEKSVQI